MTSEAQLKAIRKYQDNNYTRMLIRKDLHVKLKKCAKDKKISMQEVLKNLLDNAIELMQ